MPELGGSAAEVAKRVGVSVGQLLPQLRRMIGRMLDKHQRAAALFLDDQGVPKREAAEWFRDLARDNYVNGGAWHENDREHAKREGRRELALEIISAARLDVERLGTLTRLEREVE